MRLVVGTLGELRRHGLVFRVGDERLDRGKRRAPAQREVEREALRARVELGVLGREQDPAVGGGHGIQWPATRNPDAANRSTSAMSPAIVASMRSPRRQ